MTEPRRFVGPDSADIRGVRQIAPGVVEIVAYAGRGAGLAWLSAIAILIAVGESVIRGSGAIWDRYAGLLGEDTFWGQIGTDAGYRACLRTLDFYPGCKPGLTPEEYYYDIFLPQIVRSGTLAEALFPVVLAMLPFLYLLLWKRPPPVRMEGNHRIAYTWRPARLFGLIRGRLFIAPYTTHKLVMPTKRKFDAVAGDAMSGPVALQLEDASDPQKTRIFRVGPYSALPKETTAQVAWTRASRVFGVDAVEASAAFRDRFRLPFWQRTSLRGMARFPSDIDSRVQAWLDRRPA